MTPGVKNEIMKAHKAGKTMTPVRKFRGKYERWGAMKCCILAKRRCSKPSVYVTYCVGFPGRIALCEKHGLERKALDKELDRTL